MILSVPDPGTDSGPRILVCGWSGAGNIGDELLTSAVVESLRCAGAVPVVVSRDPQATSALHGVETVARGPRGWLRALAEGRGGSGVKEGSGVAKGSGGAKGSGVKEGSGGAKGSGGAIDGVCIGPGGIIQDWTSIWSLPGHLLAPLGPALRGRPVVGVGLGADPLKRGWSRRILRTLLRDSPVVVRDRASAAAMAAAGVDTAVGADLVFGLDLDALPRRTEIVVALGPGAAPGPLRPAGRSLSTEDPSRVAAGLGALAERLGATVALACFRGGRDRQYAQLLASRIRLDTEILGPGIDAQVDRIRSARLLVSSRYHPVVIAARSGTPAIVCSNEAKLGSLVAQLDSPLVARVQDWSQLAACEVPEPGDPVVPPGVSLHHDALRALVAASAAR